MAGRLVFFAAHGSQPRREPGNDGCNCYRALEQSVPLTSVLTLGTLHRTFD